MDRQSPPPLPCLCATLRRGSRALTAVYEQALLPFAVSASQFTILQALAQVGELSQWQLGAVLAMDSTTLTRTLKIMRRHRWIAERRGKDRRERHLRLAVRGKQLLERATPIWEKTQSRLQQQLGSGDWKQLFQLTDRITEILKTQKESL